MSGLSQDRAWRVVGCGEKIPRLTNQDFMNQGFIMGSGRFEKGEGESELGFWVWQV